MEKTLYIRWIALLGFRTWPKKSGQREKIGALGVHDCLSKLNYTLGWCGGNEGGSYNVHLVLWVGVFAFVGVLWGGGGGWVGGVKNCGNCLQIKSSAKWEIPVTENIYNSMKIKFNAKKNSSSYSDYVLLIKSYSNIHIIFKQRSESHNVL